MLESFLATKPSRHFIGVSRRRARLLPGARFIVVSFSPSNIFFGNSFFYAPIGQTAPRRCVSENMVEDADARGCVFVQFAGQAVSAADFELGALQGKPRRRPGGSRIKGVNKDGGSMGVFFLHVLGTVSVTLLQIGYVENGAALDVLVDPITTPPKEAVARTFAVLLSQVQNGDWKLKFFDLAWAEAN